MHAAHVLGEEVLAIEFVVDGAGVGDGVRMTGSSPRRGRGFASMGGGGGGRDGDAGTDVAPIDAEPQMLGRDVAFPLVLGPECGWTSVAAETADKGAGVRCESMFAQGGQRLEEFGTVRAGGFSRFGGERRGGGRDWGEGFGGAFGDFGRFG